jgi:hypothetical protein
MLSPDWVHREVDGALRILARDCLQLYVFFVAVSLLTRVEHGLEDTTLFYALQVTAFLLITWLRSEHDSGDSNSLLV